MCASYIVLFNSSFGYKKYASGDAASSRYSNMSPHNVKLTLKGSDFSGQ